MYILLSEEKTYRDHGAKLLRPDELLTIKELVEILNPFWECTKLLSGRDYVTISLILPSLTRLLSILHLIETSKLLDPIVKELINSLTERSKVYFKQPMILAATFLDPRHRKFKFIKYVILLLKKC